MILTYEQLIFKMQNDMEALNSPDLAELAKLMGFNARYIDGSLFEVEDDKNLETK